MRKLPIALLAAGVTAGVVSGPSSAATLTVGSDLSQPATVAFGDPNDVLFWSADGPAGVEVPVQGEVRAIRLKGGTVQTAAQVKRAEAFDPKYDIMHWIVLRKQDDGTWRMPAFGASEDVVAPVLGQDGVTPDTITTIRQPKDDYRVCVKPGDRVALATVGGYVPSIFDNGLQYQVFGRGGQGTTNEWRQGKPGAITSDTTMRSTSLGGVELLMQAEIGTGPDARFTCQTAAEQAGAAGPRGGQKAAAPLRPMATPLARSRRLSKRGDVPVSLTCRKEGTACTGTIELRAHKTRIALTRYALAPGAAGVFTVKLTGQGKRFVNVASARKLRTAIVVTAAGGRKAGATINIRPFKR